MSFDPFNLHPVLLDALAAAGFTTPTPVQTEAIPHLLENGDALVSAPTGTGKTAAYTLPTLHRILSNPLPPARGPRALVVCPTRELAEQVESNIRTLRGQARLYTVAVIGGAPYPPQIQALSRPHDVLIATPGRLLDHLSAGRGQLDRVETLILDEADRMLDLGFMEDIEVIAAAVPENRQTIMFSATVSREVERIAGSLLREPKRIAVSAPNTAPIAIEQRVHLAHDYGHKLAMLERLLADDAISQAVVFVGRRLDAESVAERLTEAGIRSAPLHGALRQSQRRRIVADMQRNTLRVLVATDVAARGLDIRGLSHVINFDLPHAPEDYLHRIGRTGRAGRSGLAISLIGAADARKLHGIERMTGKKIDRHHIEGLEGPDDSSFERGGPSRGRGGPRTGRGGFGGRGPRDFQDRAPRSAEGFVARPPREGSFDPGRRDFADRSGERPARPPRHDAPPRYEGGFTPRPEPRFPRPAQQGNDFGNTRPGARPGGFRDRPDGQGGPAPSRDWQPRAPRPAAGYQGGNYQGGGYQGGGYQDRGPQGGGFDRRGGGPRPFGQGGYGGPGQGTGQGPGHGPGHGPRDGFRAAPNRAPRSERPGDAPFREQPAARDNPGNRPRVEWED